MYNQTVQHCHWTIVLVNCDISVVGVLHSVEHFSIQWPSGVDFTVGKAQTVLTQGCNSVLACSGDRRSIQLSDPQCYTITIPLIRRTGQVPRKPPG
jgi:hypothetical protein